MTNLSRDEGRDEILPWRVADTSHPLRDRWISVRADRCITADGVEINPFYVLEYPDWVQVVAIDEIDRVLLVEQYRHGLSVASLEVPTGAVELTDTCTMDAAIRELREETGYTSVDWRPIAILAPNPANQNNRCHVFLALGAKQTDAPIGDPTEHVQLRPVSINRAVVAARSGEVCQAMHVAALALTLTSIGRWD